MESYGAGVSLSGAEAETTLLAKLHNHAGIFPPTARQLEKFAEIYLQALASADLLGLMLSPFEGWLLAKSRTKARRCALASLEPFHSEDPWSAELRGRRVLVVHPFAESITAQYKASRQVLFDDVRMLPAFELTVVKAPQTMCGMTCGFSSWHAALDDLKTRVQRVGFDVALVGCGAYGLPLASFIKISLGKPVIQLGGSTQILFGVSGERWRRRPEFCSLMNEYWKPPLEHERPPGWQLIEEGCYW